MVLPYATVAQINSLKGTTSDSEGRFELKLGSFSEGDSIEISYIGYQSSRLSILNTKTEVKIALVPSTELLNVVVVRPISASEYLKFVQSKLESNTAQYSFNTISHYEERTTENGRILGHNEGVFKSWHSAYRKGADIQHQLLLYRREDLEQLQFMKKKAAKEKRKYLKKNPDNADQFEEGQLIVTDFGGPESIQELNLFATSLFILDSTKHSHIEFTYLPETEYMGEILTVISYKSKAKLDNRSFSGTVYVDKQTDAVVWIEEDGRFVIPAIAKPILFAMGLSIHDIKYSMEIKMRPINEKWYPQFTHWDVQIGITKKHIFEKNERAEFIIKQELETTDIITDGVHIIPEPKRFDSNEKMSEQVHPITGITW
jgi:hypothetical protein